MRMITKNGRHVLGFIGLVFILLLAACGPKPAVKSVGGPPDPGSALFESAKREAGQGKSTEALSKFSEYLTRYPNGPHVPHVLLEIATIYEKQGSYAAATQAYQRLVRQYSGTAAARTAYAGFLELLFEQNRHEEMLRLAPGITRDIAPGGQSFRIYRTLGDAGARLGRVETAFYYYAAAYGEASGRDRNDILQRMKTILPRLQIENIETLLSRIQDSAPMGYLLYQLGLKRIQRDEFEIAAQVFSELVDRLPDHEYAEDARKLIEELDQFHIFEPFTIGCVLPLSGPYKTYGERALRGIEFALHGLISDDLSGARVVVLDSESDPTKAADSVKTLASEKIAAVIGPIISVETAALTAQELALPIITLTQKDKIAQMGDYVFRHFITPQMQVETLVDYTTRELGLNRFAILYPDEKYGKTYMNLFWDALLTQNATLVGLESYSSEQTDFADPIKKLVGLYYDIPEDLAFEAQLGLDWTYFRHENLFADVLVAGEVTSGMEPEAESSPLDEEPETEDDPEPIVDFEALFIPDAPQMAGMIVPQLAFYDIKDIYLIGTNLWNSDQLIQMASPYLRNAILADGFFQKSRSEIVNDFVTKFESLYGAPPGFMEAVAYDTTMILFDILRRPETKSRRNICDALKGLEAYPGVTGATGFTQEGEARKELTVLKIRGSRFSAVERIPAAGLLTVPWKTEDTDSVPAP